MSVESPFPFLAREPDLLAGTLLEAGARLLLLGAPGVGKSTLAAQLARSLSRRGRACACISADPGSPAFGLPGAVSLGVWRETGWRNIASEALCTLDAGRFRLPLIDAVRRLMEGVPEGPVLIDAPGVTRGVAGAELVQALVNATGANCLLALVREGGRVPLPEELRALALQVFVSPAASEAARPGKRARARARTRLWDHYLSDAQTYALDLAELTVVGTAPPRDLTGSWVGRQVAVLDNRPATHTLGEITAVSGSTLTVRMPLAPPSRVILLIRDAQRMSDGQLGSARSGAPGAGWTSPPPDMLPPAAPEAGPRPLVRLGPVTASLVNGIFGDPLLHLRLRHQKRSLLFDLGESTRLAARIAHQVSDVFISHAHFDHIAGFLWLLRSRIGVTSPCRLYGPPGLTRHILGLVSGVHWDRIGDRGPRFEIVELRGDRLVCHRLQTGQPGAQLTAEQRSPDGVLLEDTGFRVRGETLDHGIPVLAFAFETGETLNVRRERLDEAGLPVGPWLGELKRALHRGQPESLIAVPDGRREPAGALAEQLLHVTAGQKLVYATDLADTPANRERLTAFAFEADALFCEAAFASRDREQSIRTGHLTARACGEIATAARVARLVPFHFSRRYQGDPSEVYGEVQDACSCALVPGLR
jgi:ribonuclease Z